MVNTLCPWGHWGRNAVDVMGSMGERRCGEAREPDVRTTGRQVMQRTDRMRIGARSGKMGWRKLTESVVGLTDTQLSRGRLAVRKIRKTGRQRTRSWLRAERHEIMRSYIRESLTTALQCSQAARPTSITHSSIIRLPRTGHLSVTRPRRRVHILHIHLNNGPVSTPLYSRSKPFHLTCLIASVPVIITGFPFSLGSSPPTDNAGRSFISSLHPSLCNSFTLLKRCEQ